MEWKEGIIHGEIILLHFHVVSKTYEGGLYMGVYGSFMKYLRTYFVIIIIPIIIIII